MSSESATKQKLTCSVVVCTRDRPSVLETCLSGISKQIFPPLEVIVVDNAPENASAEATALRWKARYVYESALGASRARNRGAVEAKGDVIAYIDDDAFPEPGWLGALVAAFDEPTTVAVGGRVVPPSAEPEIVNLCCLIQGSGAARIPFHLDRTDPQWFEIAAFGGVCASGANLAFRRAIFSDWSGFDIRLGPPRNGCEDVYAFLNLVDGGYRTAYVPDAVVTHPTSYSVERLKRRYLTGCTHAISYILFLLAYLPQHRGKLTKYIFEGIIGVRRKWRQEPKTSERYRGVSAWKVHLARINGILLFARSRLTAK
jgi:GT2 family glycosyltransferase